MYILYVGKKQIIFRLVSFSSRADLNMNDNSDWIETDLSPKIALVECPHLSHYNTWFNANPF